MSSLETKLLKAFQVLDEHVTEEMILEACRRLFLDSDEYKVSLQQSFEPAEVDAVAKAIYGYIFDPPDPSVREIMFAHSRLLEGRVIEYHEYAATFSQDMMYQNYSRDFASLDPSELRRAVMTFLVGILFRFQFCVSGDSAAFPISAILKYVDTVLMLLERSKRECAPDVMKVTLEALASLEATHQAAALEMLASQGISFVGLRGPPTGAPPVEPLP